MAAGGKEGEEITLFDVVAANWAASQAHQLEQDVLPPLHITQVPPDLSVAGTSATVEHVSTLVKTTP